MISDVRESIRLIRNLKISVTNWRLASANLKSAEPWYDFQRSEALGMKGFNVVCLLLGLCLVASCAPASQGSQEGGDPLTGTWVGDFGPAFYDRNTISLELNWDGKKLTGMVRPGTPGGRMYRNFTGFPIENASFDPATGVVKFEATYEPRGRRYVIEAKLNKNTLSGTWNRPQEKRDGDFKLTRQTGN
ncbi:MAG: hypothetical protein DMG11_16720 [Acidobacteria bacterium]|nr:MAG: hypothetical protein DMG11_16720 [Acidobacteriota bacterium]